MAKSRAKAKKAVTAEIEVDNYGGGGTTGSSSGAPGVVAFDKKQRASGPEAHIKPSYQDQPHAPRRTTGRPATAATRPTRRR